MEREEQELNKLFDFFREIDKEKLIGRQTLLADGSRKENDAEHAWHKHTTCGLHIVVDNVLYIWDSLPVAQTKESGVFEFSINSPVKVLKRRKYPRLEISNPCSIDIMGSTEKYQGRMANISANGFAFEVKSDKFANMTNHRIKIHIPTFEVEEARELDGIVIRSSNNNGKYVVGCRMIDDNMAIKAYVEAKEK